MPKRILILVVEIFVLLSALTTPSYAISPTISPTGQPTCDLCGWCNKSINTPPANWDQCSNCLYDTNGIPKPKTYYTIFGCLSTEPQLFVKSLLSIIIGISGGIAFISVIAGSAIVLTSAGDPQRLQMGKDMITSAIFGILLIAFSVFLLKVIGLDILKIPGFG